MSEQTDNLKNILEPFGLDDDESQIYLYLLEKGIATALNISRNIHMGRTKVYRILDRLIDKQLVIQKIDHAGLKFIASNPSQLELLLTQKETELSSLRSTLPQVLNTLKTRVGITNPGSQVLYYRGKQGLAQVNWNLLKAKGVFYSYEVTTADVYMPQREAEKLRQELVNHRIMTKTITNRKKVKPYTDVVEMIKNWWQIKYIPKSVLNIQADVFIYNDIFAECHYLNDGDVFCYEMKNQQLAQMQKELFENMWKQAKTLKIFNEHGKAVL